MLLKGLGAAFSSIGRSYPHPHPPASGPRAAGSNHQCHASRHSETGSPQLTQVCRSVCGRRALPGASGRGSCKQCADSHHEDCGHNSAPVGEGAASACSGAGGLDFCVSMCVCVYLCMCVHVCFLGGSILFTQMIPHMSVHAVHTSNMFLSPLDSHLIRISSSNSFFFKGAATPCRHDSVRTSSYSVLW